jgi:glyoxylase-like metal-dependent hydrolase (beta-lactamase superfamily II)
MKIFLFFCVLIFVFAPANFAQDAAEKTNEKAREILDKSIAAYGGLENLRAVQNFSIRVEGNDYHRNQSRRPDLVEMTPLRMEITVDLRNNGYRFYSERGNVGTDIGKGYDVFDGKERIYVDLRNKMKEARPVFPNWRQRFTATLPQFLVLNALEQAANLKYVGKTNYDNRPHEVISLAAPNGTQNSLYVDAETYLISKHESPLSDAFSGDTNQETVFQSYKTVGKFKVPSEITTSTAGVKNYTWRYVDVLFDKNLTGNEFKAEADFPTKTAAAASNEQPVQKLGENVYAVRAGGYRVLAAALKDYIFVMEAPIGDSASKDVIAKIKEKMPGKPIKYLAVSHHHIDHAGGARTYIAEGATLVTTKGNQNYFEQLVKSRFTIAPDMLARNPQPLKIEFIENGKRVFTDGVTTIELYDIGTNPHTEEMLVAYLPKEKILFQADLFDDLSGLRSRTTMQLADWIESKKLAVETILPVHGKATTIEEFRRDAANFRKAQKQ